MWSGGQIHSSRKKLPRKSLAFLELTIHLLQAKSNIEKGTLLHAIAVCIIVPLFFERLLLFNLKKDSDKGVLMWFFWNFVKGLKLV